MAVVKKSTTGTQVPRFVLVGLASVAGDCLIYTSLCTVGGNRVVAKGLSYIGGMCVGFLGNKRWTFQSSRTTFVEPLVYCGVYAITFAVNVVINAAVLSAMGDAGSLVAFVCATGMTTVLNFFGMKYVAFRGRITTAS